MQNSKKKSLLICFRFYEETEKEKHTVEIKYNYTTKLIVIEM